MRINTNNVSSCIYFQAELGKDAKRLSFKTSDLENLSGSYDTVLCIDVMIHYPTEKVSRHRPSGGRRARERELSFVVRLMSFFFLLYFILFFIKH